MLSLYMKVALLTIALPPPAPATARLIDLSYTYNRDAPTSPKLTPFRLDIVKKGLNKHGIWVELNDIHTSEHSGTHIDAPVHFKQGGWAVNEIPTSRLWRRPGVKIDLSRTILRSGHKNYEVRVADLEAWEAAHDVIPDSAVVLIRTGWDKRNKTTRSYSGLDQHNKLNFPGLSVEAAEWIVAHQEKHNHKEGIIGVGIDTLSLDIGQSFDYPVHVKLLNYSIYGIENLHNLDLLPDKDFYVSVLPMRIGGGSGAPARIVAETGETISMHALAPPRPAACLALVIAALTSLYLHTL